LDDSLTEEEQSVQNAFISMIEYDLGNAWFYCLFLENENYIHLHELHNPTVNSYIYSRAFKDRVGIRLSALDYKSIIRKIHPDIADLNDSQKTTDQILEKLETVYQRARKCYIALDEHLGGKDFMHGDKITTLDAIAYGHLALHLYPGFKVPRLLSILTFEFPNLVNYVENLHRIVTAVPIVQSPNQTLNFKQILMEFLKHPEYLINGMENIGIVDRSSDDRKERFWNGLSIAGAVMFFAVFFVKSRNITASKVLQFF
jgi:metaxin